jgi:hypothetical protein
LGALGVSRTLFDQAVEQAPWGEISLWCPLNQALAIRSTARRAGSSAGDRARGAGRRNIDMRFSMKRCRLMSATVLTLACLCLCLACVVAVMAQVSNPPATQPVANHYTSSPVRRDSSTSSIQSPAEPVMEPSTSRAIRTVWHEINTPLTGPSENESPARGPRRHARGEVKLPNAAAPAKTAEDLVKPWQRGHPESPGWMPHAETSEQRCREDVLVRWAMIVVVCLLHDFEWFVGVMTATCSEARRGGECRTLLHCDGSHRRLPNVPARKSDRVSSTSTVSGSNHNPEGDC